MQLCGNPGVRRHWVTCRNSICLAGQGCVRSLFPVSKAYWQVVQRQRSPRWPGRQQHLLLLLLKKETDTVLCRRASTLHAATCKIFPGISEVIYNHVGTL